ncbi:FIST signal transduction protein [Nostoc sp. CMAA1605]|uniref:FIST signal transduction protein n=1 Tax=Nostoc sp. CMAA1605 TaxID=2055159 RepID=UPI001F3D84AE|nr:FIST N-terminal domain-containing protein [Nostoc sp. CMAA1605]MCF4966186.1 hypothetical protein [Nostoc sp. CMAA1605]
MLKVVVGHSDDPDSQAAIEEVLAKCVHDLSDLTDIPPQAAMLFAAIDFDHALILQKISAVFPEIDLIGCTTDGEMSSILGFQQDSLTLMLFCSDTVEIHAGLGYGVKANPLNAAQEAVQKAKEKSDKPAQLCIPLPASYLADGSTTNGGLILEGLKSALGSDIPIVGGAAGDQFRFQTTYQFFQTEVLTDSLPILIFAGDILFSYGTACGWEPMGRRSVITKSQGTVLYEIDGVSALEFYQRYLGDRTPTAENPLAVYEGDSDRYYMRVPNTFDPQTGSINFLGDVPEQAIVQMTDFNREEILCSVKSSLQTALARYPGTEPDAILLFSCCCRRWLLGTKAKEEYQMIKSELAKDIPICGFYTYGEFAPLESQGSTYYHQETFVTLLLGTK